MADVTFHFSVDRFSSLCQTIEKNIITTNHLGDVTCLRCLDIAEDIAEQAAEVWPQQGDN